MTGRGAGETIAAVATAPGAGGIAVVRISGPDAIAIAQAIVGRELPERRVVVARARGGDGAAIDTVLAFAMRGPRSFTGEDVAELHGHGGGVNSARLLRAVLERGARAAEPGEFSRRAFEHGRIDLTRAEAIAAVIGAGSERAWRQAQDQLSGALGARVAALRADAVHVLAEIEATIDFPDEGLDLPATSALAARCGALAEACGALAATYRAGRAVRDGVVVALAGPGNAGKSSLFNALLGRERSIVSDAPGTTRDYVEARCEWDGIAVTLVDTAGEREAASDEIERRGVALAAERIAIADVIVWVSEGGATDAGAARFGARAVRVRSKADLGTSADGALATSVRDGRGLAELRRAVLSSAGVDDAEGGAGIVVAHERQRDAIARAAAAFGAAAHGLTVARPIEAVAIDVRDGARALGEVLGEDLTEAVLDALFAEFCIGK
jgi:tRNA modification GTPase